MKKLLIMTCAVLFASASFAALPDMAEFMAAVRDKQTDNRNSKPAPGVNGKSGQSYTASDQKKITDILDNTIEPHLRYFKTACAFTAKLGKDYKKDAESCLAGVADLEKLVEEMKTNLPKKEFNASFQKYLKSWDKYQPLILSAISDMTDTEYNVYAVSEYVYEHTSVLLEVAEIAGVEYNPANE